MERVRAARPTMNARAPAQDHRVAALRRLLDDRARDRPRAARGRPSPARCSAGSGGMASSGRARGERRGDALPEARQALVVALRLLLGDARPLGDRADDLAVQELGAEALGERRRDRTCPPAPNWREMVMTGIGVLGGPSVRSGRGGLAASIRPCA